MGRMLDVKLRKQLGTWTLDVEFRGASPRLAIWGESGSGKTITLKMIAGLIRPDSGRVEIEKRVLYDSEQSVNLSPQHRRVGMMFQSYALFPHLSVQDNLAFAVRDDRDWRDRACDMADKLEIRHLLDRRPADISGGQRQRVALGRALLANPKIILLDEPFSSLDVDLRDRLRIDLAELLDQFGVPSIVVTHDAEDIRALAREVVTYCAGKSSQSVALPAELLRPPEPRRDSLHHFLSLHSPCDSTVF